MVERKIARVFLKKQHFHFTIAFQLYSVSGSLSKEFIASPVRQGLYPYNLWMYIFVYLWIFNIYLPLGKMNNSCQLGADGGRVFSCQICNCPRRRVHESIFHSCGNTDHIFMTCLFIKTNQTQEFKGWHTCRARGTNIPQRLNVLGILSSLSSPRGFSMMYEVPAREIGRFCMNQGLFIGFEPKTVNDFILSEGREF